MHVVGKLSGLSGIPPYLRNFLLRRFARDQAAVSRAFFDPPSRRRVDSSVAGNRPGDVTTFSVA